MIIGCAEKTEDGLDRRGRLKEPQALEISVQKDVREPGIGNTEAVDRLDRPVVYAEEAAEGILCRFGCDSPAVSFGRESVDVLAIMALPAGIRPGEAEDLPTG